MPVSLSDPLSATVNDQRLAHTRWFYLWNIDPLGACTCPRGSSHLGTSGGIATGSNLDCTASPGKHPWWVRKDGALRGFRHGSQDAMPFDEMERLYGPVGPARRYAMCLNETIMLDVDSPAAMRSLYRLIRWVPMDEQLLGVAKTPRGWHMYLHCPEWTQKALTAAMRAWLEDWHPVDGRKISVRGLLLDARTGGHKYTVWPGPESKDRHWARLDEFKAAVAAAGRGMPRSLMVSSGERAPWLMKMTDELRQRIASVGADRVSRKATSPALLDQDRTWAELERWAGMLEQMAPKTGRNDALNRLAFFAGTDAIEAGHSREKVYERLIRAAKDTHGAEATIESGLASGQRRYVTT